MKIIINFLIIIFIIISSVNTSFAEDEKQTMVDVRQQAMQAMWTRLERLATLIALPGDSVTTSDGSTIIISNQNNLIFQYINDISANYDKKNEILIQEYTLIPCIAFSFYTPDIEEEYYLYESIVDDSRIRLKEFNNYLTLELSCNNLSDITKIK